MPKKKEEARDVAKELEVAKTVAEVVAVIQSLIAAERREVGPVIAAVKARVRKG